MTINILVKLQNWDAPYETFFQLDFPKEMIQENKVKLIVYDIEREEIVEWKN
ncbi:fdxN element excision controlling factor protein [Calothrix parasitica NIES-267]|uniref:FdxN element excision controlling factor protein n=1 Tax=Calothrix parasitica NIES-267 TaxID=1973488 RepID=A0A1Z4M1I9_9CYAN|nr:fdxN element excision controlling factor protein [Calothrix parasitica NIES-267]